MSAGGELKSCCAAAYGSAAARFLLGDSFHPGGLGLTRALIAALDVGPESIVADIASGNGASTRLLARTTGCRVLAIDLAAACLSEAAAEAERARLGGRLFHVCADAEALPLPDAFADGVLCECALCLFPETARAASELRRVLRPGGRLALSDVWADRARLAPVLRTLDAYVACLGGARPLDQTAAILERAGFTIHRVERHDDALGEMLDRIAARLRLARLVPASPVQGWLQRGDDLLRAARAAVGDGHLGYGEVVAVA